MESVKRVVCNNNGTYKGNIIGWFDHYTLETFNNDQKTNANQPKENKYMINSV